MDGDGVAETPGKRHGVLRGDLGNSLISKQPVMKLITERIPNTLLLMVTAEGGHHYLFPSGRRPAPTSRPLPR